MKSTPYLTHFPRHFFGRGKTRAQLVLQREARKLRDRLPGELACQLQAFVSPELLEAESRTERRRHFSDPVTFWGFLSQVLSEDGSCSGALARLVAWSKDNEVAVPQSGNTGAWCQARKRLPDSLLDAVHHHLCRQLHGGTTTDMLWGGHVLKALDGSTVQLADTEANREQFPLANGQKEGCGYPILHVLGLLNLSHGGWEQWAVSSTERHDLSLARGICDELEPGDVLLGDRGFCSYEFMAVLHQRGVHPLFRLHQKRKIDKRKARKIGPHEWRITLSKPKRQPSGSTLSRQQWEGLPDQLELRLLEASREDRYGQKNQLRLVTTLADPVRYPWEEVVDLYHRRWEIETRLKDLKTTMGMEALRGRTPEMVLKELRVFIIAYNLIRLVMLQAGHRHGVCPHRLSYKGAIQLINEYAACFRGRRHQPNNCRMLIDDLLARIASRVVPDRPGRTEPRASKQRPKPYAYLTKPRSLYDEIPHRSNYRKSR